jgi:hypothetical protein
VVINPVPTGMSDKRPFRHRRLLAPRRRNERLGNRKGAVLSKVVGVRAGRVDRQLEDGVAGVAHDFAPILVSLSDGGSGS